MVATNSHSDSAVSLDEIKLRFSELQQQRMSRNLSPGDYVAWLKKMTFVAEGTPHFLIEFVLVDSSEESGRRVFRKLWLTENAFAKTQADLVKLGIRNIEDAKELQEFNILCDISVIASENDTCVAHFRRRDA